jgi:hypothetical protein
MKNLIALVSAGFLLAACALQTGCVAVAAAGAGAGAIAYVRGELSDTLEANLDRSVRASNAAITRLQFAKVSERKDALNAVIIARTAEDKKVEIRLIKIAEKSTEVKIRVEVFGDEMISRAVLEQIRANL